MLEVITLGILGSTMGSFVEALTWRIKNKRDFVKDRSECVHCGHKLGVNDLVPVISWLSLGGRCRYCKKPIGTGAILLELSGALLFIASYVLWPFALNDARQLLVFGFWLIALVLLMALFVYDKRWLLLPDKLVFPLIGVSAITVVLQYGATLTAFGSAILGILSIAGIYFALYVVSQGKWVGFGDIKLSIAIGILLGWKLSILVIMLANFIGLIVILPGLLSGRLNKKSKIPFGPFLITATIIAMLAGERIVNWYLSYLIL